MEPTVNQPLMALITRPWRWLGGTMATWHRRKQLDSLRAALLGGQQALLNWLSPLGLVDDWPLVMEVRICWKRVPGNPSLQVHPSGAGISIELSRWNSQEQQKAILAVTRTIKYKPWVCEHVSELPVASDALAWTILDFLKRKNDELARIMSPELMTEYTKEPAAATTSLALQFISSIEAALQHIDATAAEFSALSESRIALDFAVAISGHRLSELPAASNTPGSAEPAESRAAPRNAASFVWESPSVKAILKRPEGSPIDLSDLSEEEIDALIGEARGMWADHPEITDSVQWVRGLREGLTKNYPEHD